jgi:hypothetical protein
MSQAEDALLRIFSQDSLDLGFVDSYPFLMMMCLHVQCYMFTHWELFQSDLETSLPRSKTCVP